MRRLRVLTFIGLIAVLIGCEPITIDFGDLGGVQVPSTETWVIPHRPSPYQSVPPMDLPMEWRTKNYLGGSCVHASMVSCLRWQGHDELADWWRQTYSGGEHSSGLISKADRAGLKFAYTKDGDPNFLDWCSRTRRGAVIFYKPSHSINFNGWVLRDGREHAALLDNNNVSRYEYVPRDTFISRWRGYGGFGFTVVYDPPPPKPYRNLKPSHKGDTP